MNTKEKELLLKEYSNRIPNWIIELMQKWHINYRLPAHLFVPVTETFNPYK